MSAVRVDLYTEHIMALTNCLSNLPPDSFRLVRGSPDQHYRTFRAGDALTTLRLPLGVERVLDRIIYELNIVPLIAGLLSQEVSGPLVLHLKAYKRTGGHLR